MNLNLHKHFAFGGPQRYTALKGQLQRLTS